MITLSNGYSFEYVTASGAMGFDGQGWPWEQPLRWLGYLDEKLFTIVLKTITYHPRKGNLSLYNPFSCIRILNNGVLNSVGLTNPGLVEWCRQYAEHIFRKNNVIHSIQGNGKQEWKLLIEQMNRFQFVAVELNVSCSNVCTSTTHAQEIVDICKYCYKYSRHPLLLKLGVNYDVEYILQRIRGKIEAISINAVPWRFVYPNRKSPLEHLGGGALSGKIVQPYTWPFIKKLVSLSDIPVIGCSVWSYGDIKKLRILGAQAISFGSIFIPYPWRPTEFVKKDMKNKK